MISIRIGYPKYTQAGAVYPAFVDGELLVKSTEPFLDGARVLAERGFTGSIEMVGPDGSVRMTSTVETASKLRIAEGRKSGPHLRRWMPFPTSAGRRISAEGEGGRYGGSPEPQTAAGENSGEGQS